MAKTTHTFKRLAVATSLALGLTPFAGFAAENDDAVESKKAKTSATATIKQTVAQAKADSNAYYNGYVDIGGGFSGDNVGTNGYGQGDIFMPLYQNTHNLFFTDIRGVKQSGPAVEGNFGLGYRGMNAEKSWLWGLYGFYDLANSAQSNSFQQTTIGGEWKTNHWSITGNGYIPIGKTTKRVNGWDLTKTQAVDPANSIYNAYYIAGEETAMPGWDSEIGYRIPGQHSVTFYAGGYWFNAPGVESIAGPRGRVVFDFDNPFYFQDKLWQTIFQRISLEGQVQYDKPRGTNWYVGLRLRVGFGDNSHLEGVEQRMLDYIYRGEGIVSGRKMQTDYKRWNKADGSAYTIAEVSNEAQLDYGLANADVIGVNGTVGLTATKQLLNDQYLTGGDLNFNPGDGHSYNVQVGSSGVLNGPAGTSMLQLGANNTITNITLNGGGGAGGTSVITNRVATPPLELGAGETGASVGTLTIDTVNTTNGGIDLLTSDGSTNSVLNLTNSTIAVDQYAYGMQVEVQNGAFTVNNMTGNTFTRSYEVNPDDGDLVRFIAHADGLNPDGTDVTSTLTLSTVTGNHFNMSTDVDETLVGKEMNLVYVDAVAENGGQASVNITNFNDNHFKALGVFHHITGLHVGAHSQDDNSKATVAATNINSNTVNFTTANVPDVDLPIKGRAVGFHFSGLSEGGDANVVVNSVTGNDFTFTALNVPYISTGPSIGMSIDNAVLTEEHHSGATSTIQLKEVNGNHFKFHDVSVLSGKTVDKGVEVLNASGDVYHSGRTVVDEAKVDIDSFNGNTFDFNREGHVMDVDAVAFNPDLLIKPKVEVNITDVTNNDVTFQTADDKNRGFKFEGIEGRGVVMTLNNIKDNKFDFAGDTTATAFSFKTDALIGPSITVNGSANAAALAAANGVTTDNVDVPTDTHITFNA
mgnify:CR=1 FL=1|tara:strand:+ start:39614 stop:42373 length:2760 start_codon:yes stop_codon:yes gene_type:complete